MAFSPSYQNVSLACTVSFQGQIIKIDIINDACFELFKSSVHVFGRKTSLLINSNRVRYVQQVIDADDSSELHSGTWSFKINEHSGYLDYWQLTDLISLLERRNNKIRDMNLGWNRLGVMGAKAVADALSSRYCVLESLNLAGNYLSDYGVIALSKTLKMSNLVTLNVADNSIGPIGASILAQTGNDLRSLSLEGNRIGEAGVVAISQLLEAQNNKLLSLDLSTSELKSSGAIRLATAIRNPNCKLYNLNLRQNNIGQQGATAISEALQSVNRLKRLNIAGNMIGNEEVLILSAALMHPNCKLTNLNLNDNRITDYGVAVLTGAILAENCTLRVLKLRVNPLGEFAAYLLNNLSNRKRITIKFQIG